MTKRPPPVYVHLRHADMLWLATYIAFILWVWKRLNERAVTPAEPTAYQYDAPVNYLDRADASRREFNRLQSSSSQRMKDNATIFLRQQQAKRELEVSHEQP